MPVNWINVKPLSFNVLLLLERAQLSWLPGWLPEQPFAVALHANPAVRWYLENKNPAIKTWVEALCRQHPPVDDPAAIRMAEETVMESLNDLLTYAVAPQNYADQEFLSYTDDELLSLTDFAGKIVVDLGAGTGRLTFIAAKAGAKAVFAVEPVENLRHYIREEACKIGVSNVYTVDGLITHIPFYDDFADVVMGGHVFGDDMPEELAECERVVKPGGMIIFCPGSADQEGAQHDFLVAHGFACAGFIEPPDLPVRKYWKQIQG
jgi:SAM-dependent methyltransferase